MIEYFILGSAISICIFICIDAADIISKYIDKKPYKFNKIAQYNKYFNTRFNKMIELRNIISHDATVLDLPTTQLLDTVPITESKETISEKPIINDNMLTDSFEDEWMQINKV
jgi:hypothetical protein